MVLPPPPFLPNDRVAWDEAESQLGLSFPAGLRQLFDTYGFGSIGEELYLYDPCQPAAFRKRIDMLQELLRSDSETPLPAFPASDENCFLEVARNGNADGVYLVVNRHGALDETSIWIANPGDLDYLELPCTLSELLLALMSRKGLYDLIVQEYGEFAWNLSPVFRTLTPNPSNNFLT